MIPLLIACAVIYLLLGDLAEGLFLSLSVGFVVVIFIVQQRKAERALDALRSLSSPRALVIRDGKESRIPASAVVPGDILVIQEGDRIAADAKILTATHLFIDESLLTGESATVRKRALLENREGLVFCSTLAVKGHGLARVTATGIKTEVGAIGKTLESSFSAPTRLQLETRNLVRILGAMGIVFCSLIALVYAVTRNDWPNGILAGLAAAMSLLPEEFPVVLTIFLAMGAWRLSKLNVLTRNLAAIENLGAITALCVDKTGTLTQNKMTVRTLFRDNSEAELSSVVLPEPFHEVLEFGVLASQQKPFDPMELAIHEALNVKLAGTEHVHGDWQIVEEYPLSDELLAMSCVWKGPGTTELMVASKGAPEAILGLCHLPKGESRSIQLHAKEMAGQGLRVLGVARARFNSSDLPQNQHDFDFEFIGLIGLEDPIRPGVGSAIATCRSAGVRVLMITGDYPATALKIASEAGLDSTAGVLTGDEIREMSDLLFKERLKSVNIFARTMPEQKLRIVNALRENGEVVAMTGDGVNDAPGLKWADIGIAMGGRGTDVAREASDLVILDDQFGSIVNGIERGRLIYANIKRAMAFIFAVHVPIAGLTFIPILLQWPLLLFPAHIAFLELIIDPACTLVFENGKEGPDLMKNPPRPAGESIFSWRFIGSNSIAGALVFGTLIAATVFLKNRGENMEVVRTTIFLALIVSNLGLIALFSGKSKKSVMWIASLVVGLWILIWFLPSLRHIFALSGPTFSITLTGFVVAGLSLFLAGLWRLCNHCVVEGPR
ncbi:MAG: cation-translocating P-type ATPase [Bdellovibrionales bacterium]